MEIDQEIQKAIDDYIESLNNKEEELLAFKDQVGAVISMSEEELEEMTKNLDKDFNDNKLNDDTYLDKYKESKKKIIEKTEQKLNDLVKGLV